MRAQVMALQVLLVNLLVVAINVSLIPHGSLDAERYGLAATYGVGPQCVTVNRETAEVVDSGFQHRPQLLRSSGSSVDAAPFLHAGFEHVSAALISAADAPNCPTPLGLDLMLLPNPNAARAYSQRQLPLGREWQLTTDGRGNYRADVIEFSKR